jgi:hypothetical protein
MCTSSVVQIIASISDHQKTLSKGFQHIIKAQPQAIHGTADLLPWFIQRNAKAKPPQSAGNAR